MNDDIKNKELHPILKEKGLIGAFEMIKEDSVDYGYGCLKYFNILDFSPLTEESVNDFLWKYY